MEASDRWLYDLEIREAEGVAGRVSGMAMVYGDSANIGNGLRETFLPGSLRRPPDGPVFANVRHDQGKLLAASHPDNTGSLTVEFREDGVHVAFDLPNTTLGREAAVMARAGVLRGLSIEFKALKQEYRALKRTIADAYMFGVGMVPRPAYQLSTAEVRAINEGRPFFRRWVY